MEKNYVRYEIEERKWSANAVEGVYVSVDEHGKKKEKRDYILSCANIGKKKGDEYAKKICTFLNDKESKIREDQAGKIYDFLKDEKESEVKSDDDTLIEISFDPGAWRIVAVTLGVLLFITLLFYFKLPK